MIKVNIQSSILIDEGIKIYFDPLKIEKKYDADYIFITHSHYDHFSKEDILNIKNDNDLDYSSKIDLIFTKKNGLYNGADIIKYPYSIIHHELGIKKCRFYDLRGSYATKTLKSGVEIRDVADILGHKNVETTENYYISSTASSRKEAVEIFEKTTQSNIITNISQYRIEK